MTKKEAADRKRERREMAECTPDQKARDWFRRPAGVQMGSSPRADRFDSCWRMEQNRALKGEHNENTKISWIQ